LVCVHETPILCYVNVSCVELLQPCDRLKTEEEIAKEEKEKLEALEVSD